MNKGLIGFAALAAMLGVAAASSAKTMPVPVSPVGPPSPAPPVPTGPPDVSVRIPPGFRRMTQSEVTEALTTAAVDIMKLGDPPGTFYPFDQDGMHYGAGVEMSGGKKHVALFVEM